MRELARSSRSSVTSNKTCGQGPGRLVAARALLVTSLVFVGCANTSTPTSAPSSPIAVVVTFVLVGDGSSFTARLNGQDFTRPGASTISLTPGTYQISGTFSGGLTVGFQTLGQGGGVVAGSPRSITGPTSQVASCAITYAGSGGSADAHAFQLEFQVAANAATACAAGAP